MQLTINNFRGISTATINLNSIALVAGCNEAGKTSTAQAAAAALTGEPVPIPGVKKNQAGMLVRSGTATGTIELSSENGTTKITYPTASVKSEGQAPYASPFAVGMQSIVTMPEAERVKTLTEYLKASPTRADLDAQLKPMNLQPAALDTIWDRIQKLGWDGCLKYYSEQRATLKGQWLEVTGEQYGSKKADSWLPADYDHGLEGASEENLQAIVTDARDALEACLKTDAVDESKKQDMQTMADLLPARKIDALAADNTIIDPALANQLRECDGYIANMSAKRDALNTELKALPQPTQATGMACPDCGVVLQVVGGALVHVTGVLTDEEITTRKSAIDELTAKIKGVNDAISKHMETSSRIKGQMQVAESELITKRAECKRLVQESVMAAAQLQETTAPAGTVSVDDCRTAVATAEKRLFAFKAKHKADKLHVSVQTMESLITKIAPDGIRGDVLARSLKGFNTSLERFTTAAGWRAVTLESDFLPLYGGTPYLLLSESAKFRVRVVLQIGMALLDRSQALVVDAADILDKRGRNGLFKAVSLAGLPTMVCMTVDDKEKTPDLGKAGMGVTYWIEGGVLGSL